MPKYKVFVQRSETFYTIIEADSKEEASNIAESSQQNAQEWHFVEGSKCNDVFLVDEVKPL